MTSKEVREQQKLYARMRNNMKSAETEAFLQEHAGIVYALAKTYMTTMPYGVDPADLQQAGFLGMCEALKRFDPAAGAQFITYATPWVKSEMLKFIRHTTGALKVPEKRYWTFLAIIRYIQERQGRGEAVTIQQVAQDLHLPEQYIQYALESLKPACEEAAAELSETGNAPSAEQAFFSTYQEADILDEVSTLTIQERTALQCRFRFAPYDTGDELMGYEEVGRTMGLSTSRVYGLTQSGLAKVRDHLNGAKSA